MRMACTKVGDKGEGGEGEWHKVKAEGKKVEGLKGNDKVAR